MIQSGEFLRPKTIQSYMRFNFHCRIGNLSNLVLDTPSIQIGNNMHLLPKVEKKYKLSNINLEMLKENICLSSAPLFYHQTYLLTFSEPGDFLITLSSIYQI
jgi:hypothetical protein